MLLEPALSTQFIIEQRYETIRCEPLYSFNIKSLINSTQSFGQSTINENDTISNLTRMVYLKNQGERYPAQENELMFFRVSKLFQWKQPELRRIMYQIIKVKKSSIQIIMPPSSQQIIVSSIRNDIISMNYFLRLYGIRMIPQVFDQYNFQQFEKLIQNAITDNDEQISVSGFVVGFHLSNKFPKIVTNWQQELVLLLSEKCLNNNFHALILYKRLKEKDMLGLVYMLKQMIKQQLIPIIVMQVIKFIQFIIEEYQNREQNTFNEQIKNEFHQYLLTQLFYQESIVTIQSINAIISLKQTSSHQLKLAVEIIFSKIDHQYNAIETYALLKILNKIILQIRQEKWITQQMKDKIQSCIFSHHVSISSLAIRLFILINYLRQDTCYIDIFKITDQSELKHNYIRGMFEFLLTYSYDGDQILQLAEITIEQRPNDDMLKSVFMILEFLIRDQAKFQPYSLSLLFKIQSQSKDQSFKSYLIKIVYFYIVRVRGFDLSEEKLILVFDQLKLCYFQAKQKADQSTQKEDFFSKQYQDVFLKQFKILVKNLYIDLRIY
ncbi:hypothetical protein pb186bvf_000747 [Paramecium bursaria]